VIAARGFPEGGSFDRVSSAAEASSAGLAKLQKAADDPVWGK
jgi:hypothetical protein